MKLSHNSLPFHGTNIDMGSFLGRIERKDVDLNAPYQRASVWTTSDQRELIHSLIDGLPIPSIVINDRSRTRAVPVDEAQWVVIDGKQRVEALLAWYGGELTVPAAWFHSDALTEGHGDMVNFTQLSGFGKRAMENISLSLSVGSLATVEEEARAFVALNTTGVAQAEGDIDRARSMA